MASPSASFVSMKEVLSFMQSERGFDKRGRRRQVTIADFLKLDDNQRKALTERITLGRTKQS